MRSSRVSASGLRPIASWGSWRIAALGIGLILPFVQQERFHRGPINRARLPLRPCGVEGSVLIGVVGALGFHAGLYTRAECLFQNRRRTLGERKLGVDHRSQAVDSLHARRAWLDEEIERRIRIG